MKLKRARQFLAELEAAEEEYRKSNPVTGYPDKDQPGVFSVDVKGSGDWPCAIVGDAIHNLRTALDLMASELARRNGHSDKDVYFPFSDSKESLDDAIKRRSFHKAGPDAVALLREFAPYRGGNVALRAIHDLDIQDKHTGILIVGQAYRVEVKVLIDPQQNTVTSSFLPAADIHLTFGRGTEPFIRERAVETLKALVELTAGVVEAFKALPTPAG